MALPDRQLNAFLVGRSLIDRARTLVDGTDAGEIGAVILNDLAVETVGKAVADDKHDGSAYPGAASDYKTKPNDRSPRNEPGFVLTVDRLLAAYRVRSADPAARSSALQGALRLHRLRNIAQHEGRVPSSADRVDAEREAIDALQWMALTFYDLQLEAISRASLIVSPAVRICVESAERHASTGDLVVAIADLWVALERAQRAANSADPLKGQEQHLWIRQAVDAAFPRSRSNTPGYGAGSGLRIVLEELEKRIERLQEQVDAVSLGEDAAEYAWFQRVSTRPWVNVNDEWHLPEPSREPTLAEYRRAYEFVVRAVLRWQRLPISLEGAPEHTYGLGQRPYDAPRLGND